MTGSTIEAVGKNAAIFLRLFAVIFPCRYLTPRLAVSFYQSAYNSKYFVEIQLITTVGVMDAAVAAFVISPTNTGR
jgi:hypothetical protein